MNYTKIKISSQKVVEQVNKMIYYNLKRYKVIRNIFFLPFIRQLELYSFKIKIYSISLIKKCYIYIQTNHIYFFICCLNLCFLQKNGEHPFNETFLPKSHAGHFPLFQSFPTSYSSSLF